jgi:hypothetical protein
MPRRLLHRSARVDAQDLGYLHALLTRCRPDFQDSARRDGAVAAALDHTDVEKGIAAGWKLCEAEALFRIVPFHRG